MSEYDLTSIFKDMESYLIDSMSRNMKRHTNWENDEGFQWEMWQAKQLEALNDYRKQNDKYVKKQFGTIKIKLDELLRQSNEHGGMQQEIRILDAIKKGFKPGRVPKGIRESFFRLNQQKLTALVNSITSDMNKATTAMLRMANDEYRKTIFRAQVFANTGTITTDQAIDLATKDFLAKGINCIQYKDGKRVNIASYAEMAIKTANQRAFLQGEGSKRAAWGIHTVLISKYGACSNICLPWQGRVYVDDVWSGGTAEESGQLKLPLLSAAIAGGLFHPNCKHTMSTYFEGITTIPSKADIKGTRENSDVIAKQRYNERQIRKYKRLENGSLDKTNKSKYEIKRKEWQLRQRDLLSEHPEVHRNYKRESLRGVNEVDTTASAIFNKSVVSEFKDDKLDIPFKNKKLSNETKKSYNKVEHKFTNGTYNIDDSYLKIAKEYELENGLKVYIPENIDTNIQPISIGQIENALIDVPLEIINNIDEIEIVDYQNPKDSVIAKIYGKKDFVSSAIGGDRRITLFPSKNNRTDDQLQAIIYHEGGHILEDEFEKKTGILISDSNDYKKAMKHDEKISGHKFVSRYATNTKSIREDIAESIKLYCKNRDTMKQKFPARTKFIKEWFKWIKENQS